MSPDDIKQGTVYRCTIVSSWWFTISPFILCTYTILVSVYVCVYVYVYAYAHAYV